MGQAGAALAGLSLMGATRGREAGNKPNFLVIVTDDQPYYTVSSTRSVVSSIGDRGTTFDPYAYVSTPICGPSRATLLTGKWSHNTELTKTTGAYQQLHSSVYESDTIATRLSRAGYGTYFGGKYTNGYDGQAIPPGWDTWFGMVEPLNKQDSFRYRNSSMIRNYDRTVYNETDVLRASAINFVRDQAGSPKPWFAYVCPHAPHEPYYPAPRYAGEFTTTPLRDVPSIGEQDLSDKPAWVQAEAPYADTEMAADTTGYRGKLRELQEVDDMVKRLIGTLANTGQLTNTYIFFVTDNGYLLGEHGLHKKHIPYEEASRTPFIVRGPGVPSGFVSSVMVSHVDIPPTLLDLAGASWSDLDGRSLLPVFSAGGQKPAGWRDEVYVEDLERGWYMLRTPQWAYVEWVNGERELYDMYNDSYQLQSLHADPAKEQLMDQFSARIGTLKSCSGNSCR
ncbi:MAG: sulfatase [Rubrobacteraceae bacterium]|nr:sulfatase [Rubrobacteraceae bacterium]